MLELEMPWVFLSREYIWDPKSCAATADATAAKEEEANAVDWYGTV